MHGTIALYLGNELIPEGGIMPFWRPVLHKNPTFFNKNIEE